MAVPSGSIYRLLRECGTQAKAIFGSQSATCLLPLASQAGLQSMWYMFVYAFGMLSCAYTHTQNADLGSVQERMLIVVALSRPK